jgi:cation diffusion facilitator CzcD-associated flavoprotein CzcO
MPNRRQFVRQTAAFGLTAGLLPGIASTTEVNAASAPNAAEPEVTGQVDVLVVGGGTAGTIAAIQAGRAGASVLLVERNSQLGGTMTTGGVAFPGLFDAWGKQVIAGIGWELVKESVELDEGNFPISPRCHSVIIIIRFTSTSFSTRSWPRRSARRRVWRSLTTNFLRR